MSTLRNATSNTLLLLIGQLITWGSTLVLAAAYGRYLGPVPFGELYLATTFTSLVGFPIEYSFNQQVVRDVAQAPEHAHRYLTGTLALKGLLWVGLFAISIVLAMALGYSTEEQWLIGICGLMLVSTAITTTLISVQTAYMQVGMAKFGTVIEKGFDVVVATLLLRAGAGVQAVALVLLVGSVAGMSWQVLRVARMIGVRFEWDFQVVRQLVRSGVSFLVYGVLGVIYYRVDTVLLSVMGTTAAIGMYGAAYRLLDTLMFIPAIVMGAVMAPLLAKYAKDSSDEESNRAKLRVAIEKSTVIMLLCSVPIAFGLLATSWNIITFIYGGDGFTGSAAILQGLAFGIVALYLNSVLTTVLISVGKEHRLPIIAAAALVFNVALNVVLIPRFMGLGAAWATALTEFLLLALSLLLIDRSLIPLRLWKPAAKILLAGTVMALVARLLAGFNILVIIPPAVATYAVLIAALRVLPPEDVALLSGAIGRKVPAPALALVRVQVRRSQVLRLHIQGWLAPLSPRVQRVRHLAVSTQEWIADIPRLRRMCNWVVNSQEWLSDTPRVRGLRERWGATPQTDQMVIPETVSPAVAALEILSSDERAREAALAPAGVQSERNIT